MKNKILLINTLDDENYWDHNNEPETIGFPSGILSIGTVLKNNGFEVKIIDPVVDKNFRENIVKEAKNCLWFGISAMTAGIKCGLIIAQILRKVSADTPIVWGGVHSTLFPESTLENELVDIVCWGEGEKTALDLSEELLKGGDLSKVKGIYYFYENKIKFSGPQSFVNLDELPIVDYDLLEMDKYLLRNMESLGVGKGFKRVFILNTGRGCPYKCTFCWNTHPSQNFRYKSIDKIKMEIDYAVKKFNPEVIHIQDDIFFCDKKRVLAFLDYYDKKKYKFKWFALSRANYFNDKYMNIEFLEHLKKSCIWLGLGVESGNSKIRKILKKEITEEQVIKSATWLSKVKIPVGYAFMIALPIETESDWLKTISLILKLKKINPDAMCGLQYFRPYPGSELYNKALEKGYAPPESLIEWGENQDLDNGFNTVDSLPWIKKRRLVKYLTLSVFFATIPLKDLSLIKKIASIFIRSSLKFRIRFNITTCPIEYYLITFVRKIIKVLKNK